jgi:hypothetical protein
MDQDVMLLAATGACAIAAAVLAVAAAWLFRLDQRLGLSQPAKPCSIQELIEILSAVGEDPARAHRLAALLGGGAGSLIAAGLRLARDKAEPLAFGRELLASASRGGRAELIDRRLVKFCTLGFLAAALTVVAWALPLLVDTAGWARMAVGLGYVGVLALFASVALSANSRPAAAEFEQQAERLVIVAFLGLSVGESREQIRARLIEAIAMPTQPARSVAMRAA